MAMSALRRRIPSLRSSPPLDNDRTVRRAPALEKNDVRKNEDHFRVENQEFLVRSTAENGIQYEKQSKEKQQRPGAAQSTGRDEGRAVPWEQLSTT